MPPHGQPPPPPRRHADRLIEYGGTLEQFEGRETMVPCKRRPGGKPCLGLLMVMKLADDRIQLHRGGDLWLAGDGLG